jgi:hypothetical protein
MQLIKREKYSQSLTTSSLTEVHLDFRVRVSVVKAAADSNDAEAHAACLSQCVDNYSLVPSVLLVTIRNNPHTSRNVCLRLLGLRQFVQPSDERRAVRHILPGGICRNSEIR